MTIFLVGLEFIMLGSQLLEMTGDVLPLSIAAPHKPNRYSRFSETYIQGSNSSYVIEKRGAFICGDGKYLQACATNILFFVRDSDALSNDFVFVKESLSKCPDRSAGSTCKG